MGRFQSVRNSRRRFKSLNYNTVLLKKAVSIRNHSWLILPSSYLESDYLGVLFVRHCEERSDAAILPLLNFRLFSSTH